MPRFDTTYAETELLLAVMEGRDDDARSIASQMYMGEQVALIEHLEHAVTVLIETDAVPLPER